MVVPAYLNAYRLYYEARAYYAAPFRNRADDFASTFVASANRLQPGALCGTVAAHCPSGVTIRLRQSAATPPTSPAATTASACLDVNGPKHHPSSSCATHRSDKCLLLTARFEPAEHTAKKPTGIR